jgi:CheY-like chemotaxis protein
MVRVLLIEDEAPIRANLRRVLCMEGYDVVEASDGLQGLEMAGTLLPDVILCDVMMPELDGFGVLKALRAEEATAAIPFVFLSASAEQSDLRNGLALGACRYVTKPFNLQHLLQVLTEVTGKASV